MPHGNCMNRLQLPIQAATEVVLAHNIRPDRCDILQDAHTLVLRLTDSLVARIVNDRDGPRQGTAWFARENAVAQFLAERGAPVIPLHPDIPPGPHERLGYPMSFWKFVVRVPDEPLGNEIGKTLYACHHLLKDFPEPPPRLAILTESIQLLETPDLFPCSTLDLLRRHLEESREILGDFPHQTLHGDAHPGNVMQTEEGLLWTDWEDAFSGPVEWDIASIIWNAKFLENDHHLVDEILTAYCAAGGRINEAALWQSFIARAAVITAWYPILYPNPNEERRSKLESRIQWLEKI